VVISNNKCEKYVIYVALGLVKNQNVQVEWQSVAITVEALIVILQLVSSYVFQMPLEMA